MSLQAMLWALYDAPTDDLPAGAFRVLLVLADHADPEGRSAYPAASSIATKLGVSRRTVERHVAALRGAGLMTMGDQHLVDHVRADRRPTVWDLVLPDLRSDSPVGSYGPTPAVGSYGPTPAVGSTTHGPTETAPTVRQKRPHGPTPAVGQNRRTKNEPSRVRARVALCGRCGFEHDATQEACRPRSAMPANVAALIRRAPPKAVP